MGCRTSAKIAVIAVFARYISSFARRTLPTRVSRERVNIRNLCKFCCHQRQVFRFLSSHHSHPRHPAAVESLPKSAPVLCIMHMYNIYRYNNLMLVSFSFRHDQFQAVVLRTQFMRIYDIIKRIVLCIIYIILFTFRSGKGCCAFRATYSEWLIFSLLNSLGTQSRTISTSPIRWYCGQ